jgi:hypothetical protein
MDEYDVDSNITVQMRQNMTKIQNALTNFQGTGNFGDFTQQDLESTFEELSESTRDLPDDSEGISDSIKSDLELLKEYMEERIGQNEMQQETNTRRPPINFSNNSDSESESDDETNPPRNGGKKTRKMRKTKTRKMRKTKRTRKMRKSKKSRRTRKMRKSKKSRKSRK